MLIILIGGIATERNSQSARFGQIAVRQAKISGENGVKASESNFAGAIAGLISSVAIAGIGFQKYKSATNSQIKNINENYRGAANLRQQQNSAANALNRQSSPMNGNSSQEKLNNLDNKFKVDANQQRLTGDEHAVLSQPMQRTEAKISAMELAGQENTYKFTQQQMSGQIISGMSIPVAAMASSGAAVDAAGHSADSKINDAEGVVASEVAHNADQLAQHSLELLGRIFSLIVSANDQNRSTLDSISQSIKA